MKGQATYGSDTTGPTVGWYRLPIAWQKLVAANDNQPPPLRRAKILLWNAAVAAIIGGICWAVLR